MNTQALFEYAQMRYRRARRLIEEMVVAHGSQPSVDLKNAYCQLDIIVQYILLKIALADGKFLEIEGEFIDQITDSYDVLYLFDKCNEDYNWSFAGAFMTFEQVKKIVRKVEKLAREHILAFSQLFASDFANKDCARELYQCINDVALAFIMSDGNVSQKELDIASDVVRDCLTEPWLATQSTIRRKK